MATKQNLVIDQGSDYSTTVQAVYANGAAMNLTSYTGASQLRKTYTPSTYYSFDVIANTANGLITLSMSSNTLNTIPAGRCVYDCEVTSAGGVKTRIVEGIVPVTPQVTR